MGWSAQIEWEREALYRIVALLLFMADLAQRAAGSSRPVPCHVLWALGQAEAVVGDFVAGRPRDPECRRPPPGAMAGGLDPAEAIDLAVRLRALAFIVHIMAAQFRLDRSEPEGQSCIGSGELRHGHRRAGTAIPRLCVAAVWLVERCDTS